jgi:hypothetical protein
MSELGQKRTSPIVGATSALDEKAENGHFLRVKETTGPHPVRARDLTTPGPGTSGNTGSSQQRCGSSDEPSSLVNVKFHQPFVSHLQ